MVEMWSEDWRTNHVTRSDDLQGPNTESRILKARHFRLKSAALCTTVTAGTVRGRPLGLPEPSSQPAAVLSHCAEL